MLCGVAPQIATTVCPRVLIQIRISCPAPPSWPNMGKSGSKPRWRNTKSRCENRSPQSNGVYTWHSFTIGGIQDTFNTDAWTLTFLQVHSGLMDNTCCRIIYSHLTSEMVSSVEQTFILYIFKSRKSHSLFKTRYCMGKKTKTLLLPVTILFKFLSICCHMIL